MRNAFDHPANSADCTLMVDSRQQLGNPRVMPALLNLLFSATTRGILLVVIFAIPVLAQDPLKEGWTMGMGDVAALKQNAEAGDAAAQVSFGKILGYIVSPQNHNTARVML